jgi:anti-sigma regulatory factor (Ser/Thr protein kinase)
VRDYGTSFDPSSYRPPVPDELPESGYGIHLMRLLTDEVRHVNEGDGTRVVMFKRLPNRSAAHHRLEEVPDRQTREKR